VSQHVAVVKQLLWVRHPGNAPWERCRLGEQLSGQVLTELDRDLRVAVLDLYSPPSHVGGMLRVGNTQHVHDSSRVVALSQLDGKVVCCQAPDSTEAFFMRYGNLSKLM